MTQPLLMPKATAVWLVDNTALSFDQIAAFFTLHPLEVQGIADGDVAGGIMGVNPIQNGQLTREEIEKACCLLKIPIEEVHLYFFDAKLRKPN